MHDVKDYHNNTEVIHQRKVGQKFVLSEVQYLSSKGI